MHQTLLSLSDFPDGGSVSPNPISPVGGSPFSSVVEAALHNGSRSRNFRAKIRRLCLTLPADASSMTKEQVVTTLKLAGLCRAKKDVCAALGDKTIVFHSGGRVSSKQTKLGTALRQGTRARNFENQIDRLCAKLPQDSENFTKEDIDAVVALARKCRSVKSVEQLLGLKPPPSVKKERIRRERLTVEQLRENRRVYERAYRKRMLVTDVRFRILHSLRRRLKDVLARRHKKSDHTLVLLGCSLSELKAHLEARWQPGMSWQNYGPEGWHIDHIRPCASFDMSQKEEQQRCFHYTNLQPLWAAENIAKGAKWDGDS